MLEALLISLGLTLLLELPFAWVLGKRKRDLLLVLLVNTLTNPAVVLLYMLAGMYTALPPALVKVVLEVAAVLVEAFYYRTYGEHFHRPLWFSLCANALSFGVGLLLNQIL